MTSLINRGCHLHRQIPQHIAVAAEFVVIPAIDNRLGNGDIQARACPFGHFLEELFHLQGYNSCSRMRLVAFDDGSRTEVTDYIRRDILLFRIFQISSFFSQGRLPIDAVDELPVDKGVILFVVKSYYQDYKGAGRNRYPNRFRNKPYAVHLRYYLPQDLGCAGTGQYYVVHDASALAQIR